MNLTAGRANAADVATAAVDVAMAVTDVAMSVTEVAMSVTAVAMTVTAVAMTVTAVAMTVTAAAMAVTAVAINVTPVAMNVTPVATAVTRGGVNVTVVRCGPSPIDRNMARPRSPYPPKTPAERQAKCRAIKRGKWYTQEGVPVPRQPQLPTTGRQAAVFHLPSASAQPPAALPAPPRPARTPAALTAPATPAVTGTHPSALPAPAARDVTAIQRATPDAAAAALPDAGGQGDAWHLGLPPAVAARLRSLLDRHDAGKTLSAAERDEAQGLLDIAEYFVVQRLRQRLAA